MLCRVVKRNAGQWLYGVAGLVAAERASLLQVVNVDIYMRLCEGFGRGPFQHMARRLKPSKVAHPRTILLRCIGLHIITIVILLAWHVKAIWQLLISETTEGRRKEVSRPEGR